MFVGHGLLAFALVAGLAEWRGWDAQRALQAGVLAALFATVPDVDILYGPVGLIGGVSGVFDAAARFWETGNQVHRGPTHSTVVGALAALGFGLAAGRGRTARGFAAATFAGLVALVTLVSGGLGGIVTVAFLTAGVVVVSLGHRWDFAPAAVGTFALVGLLSHPLGDLFTGEPPMMLYPFEATLVAERITLHQQETLHLLSAFGIELATGWLALLVYLRLTDRRVLQAVDRRAVLGAGFGIAAIVLPAPTLETSYHFVFGVLGVGVLGLTDRRVPRIDWLDAAGTALAAVTLAGSSYAVVFLLA